VTPGALARAKGKGAPPPVPVAGVGDSATAIFRMADLADGARRSPVPQPPSAPGASEAPAGLCLRFVDLDEVGRRAVAHHLQTSRQLADRIAAQGGTSVAEARLAIADSFHEGDLSRRALDW